MEITDIRVRRQDKGHVKAVVSITLDDMLAVHEIKVVEGARGLFVAMPCRQGGDGEYRDTIHPINAETRNWISEAVLKAYDEVLIANA